MISKLRKILLCAGAIGWGISVLGVLLPWSVLSSLIQSSDAFYACCDSYVAYLLRMAYGGWSIIGFLFLMVLLKPKTYGNLVPLLEIASIFEGSVLLIHGLLLRLPMFPFAADVFFCLVIGLGLLWTERKAVGLSKLHGLIIVLSLLFLCSCNKVITKEDCYGEWIPLQDESAEKCIVLSQDGTMKCNNLEWKDVASDREGTMPPSGKWTIGSENTMIMSVVNNHAKTIHFDFNDRLAGYGGYVIEQDGRIEMWFTVGDPDLYEFKKFVRK